MLNTCRVVYQHYPKCFQQCSHPEINQMHHYPEIKLFACRWGRSPLLPLVARISTLNGATPIILGNSYNQRLIVRSCGVGIIGKTCFPLGKLT